jgi:FAD/FMN-containing dehydrogenase/Fe-S oxidoreductase
MVHRHGLHAESTARIARRSLSVMHPSTSDEPSARLALRLSRHTRGTTMFDAASRGRYATDASIYQIMPVGVFVPTCDEDVTTALAVARELKVPVLPRGGGTSQCGQTVGAALVIDTSKHLRRVIDVDAAARVAVVEPGLVLDHLNAALAPHGLWYPVDVSTSAQATLGGMAGNNSCGSRSIAYGNMVHNVLGIDAWASDGTLLKLGPVDGLGGRERELARTVRNLAQQLRPEIDAHWPTVMRRVGGYNLDIFHNRSERPYTSDGSVNLAHLLVGSEGTLAFTKQLTLKLAPLPGARTLGVVSFPRFRQAMQAAQSIVALRPTAVELVDRTMVELALSNPAFEPTMRAALVGRPEAILLVEFVGDHASELPAKLDDLVELMADLGLPDSVVRMPEPARQKALWEVRKAGLNIMMSVKGDGKPVSFIEDCAVPLEHLADYTDALTEVFARHGTRGTWYAHASVGTLHVRPILDMRSDGAQGGAARMRAIAEEAAVLVRKYRGAYSGEHGDGLCRGEWIRWQFGDAITQAFAAIKHAMDPIGLFNPGKIVDPPRMDDVSLFRFPPASAPKPYRRIPIQPALDWSAWNVHSDPVTEITTAPGSGDDVTGGLASAVEMCNNNGHCRKFDAGTMCPSYRVTRDEQHLTRGRANTLRLALSGQLGPDAFTGRDVREAMSLCVSCKGCRRECPTGVDMARLKIEHLAQLRKLEGLSVLERLVAYLPDYAHTLSRLPWLANLRDVLPGASALSERLLGLSSKRSLPRWRRDTVWRSKAETTDEVVAAAGRGERVAALFVDTFNGTFESENAWAAQRVLEAAGYRVHLLRKDRGHHCCGRTRLAVGLVDDARAVLSALIDAVHPLVQAGVPIVGLEPSCLLTLRDEALVMGLGERAQTVAAQAWLFEEFIAREMRAGRWQLDLQGLDVPLLVHGHCHQKAFDAVSPVLEVLRTIPGAKPTLIESSCCGMAGSFGYEAANHEVSMRMAQASLLPAVQAAPADSIVVADGTSCRHQIADGTGRQALHVARVLERLLPQRH